MSSLLSPGAFRPLVGLLCWCVGGVGLGIVMVDGTMRVGFIFVVRGVICLSGVVVYSIVPAFCSHFVRGGSKRNDWGECGYFMWEVVGSMVGCGKGCVGLLSKKPKLVKQNGIHNIL